MVWIVVAAVVLLIAAWAFWPRKRGVVDGAALRSRAVDQGKASTYSQPSGPNFPSAHM
jgi:hypothetical protein